MAQYLISGQLAAIFSSWPPWHGTCHSLKEQYVDRGDHSQERNIITEGVSYRGQEKAEDMRSEENCGEVRDETGFTCVDLSELTFQALTLSGSVL